MLSFGHLVIFQNAKWHLQSCSTAPPIYVFHTKYLQLKAMKA